MELIIKVDNQNVSLGPMLAIPIQQTTIPIEHCSFRSNKDIFWKVELLDYSPEERSWRMKVVDYFPNDVSNFYRQKSTRVVDRISFEPFDWLHLESFLTHYQKIKLLPFISNHDTNNYREETQPKEFSTFSLKDLSRDKSNKSHPLGQQGVLSFLPVEWQPKVENHIVEFTVYFSDAYFKLGYVTFSKYVKVVGTKLDFKIYNDNILGEFENIKSWFPKRFKTKKFKVHAVIETTDGKVTEVNAASSQISMIDEELIEGIKYQRTIALARSPRVKKIDKSIFTAEEIFGEMETDNLEGNVFGQNEQDIFGYFLNENKTRNRKQLEYLSGSKQSENRKLRFTLHPNFGFLFFIEGKAKNHFVWELLNSHATYVWSIDKDNEEIGLQYKRIEASINAIRDLGREQYKRAYRQNEYDNDLLFCVIEHENVTSNLDEGFIKWKLKLNEVLT